MATNFEFYVDALIETLRAEDQEKCSARTAQVALGMKETDADTCGRGSCANCWAGILEALKQEHIEQPKLTKQERAFCEAVQTGWIARDCNMHLFYFSGKPKLEQGTWMTRVGQHCRIKGIEDAFMFIKDTDSEPWPVEDLLKLEVMEDQHETD